MSPTHRLIACAAALLALGSCTTEPVSLDPFGRPYEEENILRDVDLRSCEPKNFDQTPRLVSGTRPLFPIGEMLKGRSGSAVVHFDVTKEGAARIVFREAENIWFFNHAAVAMRDWILEPARKGGVPAATSCSLEFQYWTYDEAERRGLVKD